MFLVVSNYPSESLELGRDIRGDLVSYVSTEFGGDWLPFFVLTDSEPHLEGCPHPGCEGGGTIPDDEPGMWTTCPACNGTGVDARWPA